MNLEPEERKTLLDHEAERHAAQIAETKERVRLMRLDVQSRIWHMRAAWGEVTLLAAALIVWIVRG